MPQICNAQDEFEAAGLLQDTGYDQYFTISYNQSPTSHYAIATVLGNTLTGYFSDKAKCTGYPGNGPGTWANQRHWQSTCNGPGVKRELTLLDLYKSTSCIYGLQPSYKQEFCNSITDQGGNPRRPQLCGGNDPNVFVYNPTQQGISESAGLAEEIADEAQGVATGMVSETRKKIFAVALVLIMLIVLYFLIFR